MEVRSSSIRTVPVVRRSSGCSGCLQPALTAVLQEFETSGRLIMAKVLVAVEELGTVTEDTPIPTRLVPRAPTSPGP